jgi:hypothetical protein
MMKLMSSNSSSVRRAPVKKQSLQTSECTHTCITRVSGCCQHTKRMGQGPAAAETCTTEASRAHLMHTVACACTSSNGAAGRMLQQRSPCICWGRRHSLDSQHHVLLPLHGESSSSSTLLAKGAEVVVFQPPVDRLRLQVDGPSALPRASRPSTCASVTV